MSQDEVLYVAVSDSDNTYAGYDGGPQKGGRGRWKKDYVGPWMSSGRVPLAVRNPDDGLIWRGYLELVTAHRTKDDGSIVCITSEKVYEHPPKFESRSKAHFAAAPVAETRPATPSAEAIERASNGATPIDEVLAPSKARKGRPRKLDSISAAMQRGDHKGS